MDADVHSAASSSETLMAALLALPVPSSFPSLARSLAADALRLRCRLLLLLLSPRIFGRALARLHSLPLASKALLLSRLLLRSLLHLFPDISPHDPHLQLPPPDLDAALLLLAMCNSYSPDPSTSPVDWRALIAEDMARSALSISGLGATPWAAVAPYVDAAAKCRRFADVVSEGRVAAGEKDRAIHGAASVAAVLAMPAARGDCEPCAICREEMAAWRGVCALRPCGHRFHWPCALRWLARRNTCPCCRAEMPVEDAIAETRRLWRAVASMAHGHACA